MQINRLSHQHIGQARSALIRPLILIPETLPKQSPDAQFLNLAAAPIAFPDIRTRVSDDVIRSIWMGYKPAAAEDIGELESRIGVQLPDFHRLFLATSNVWRSSGGFIDEIFPARKAQWFRATHREWIAAYLEPPTTRTSERIGDCLWFQAPAWNQNQCFKLHLDQFLAIATLLLTVPPG